MPQTAFQHFSPASPVSQPALRTLIARYESPSITKSVLQILTSIGLFAASCAGMYWSLHISYWLTLALSVPTAGFLVRTFIVQHDCGHGAFFRSRRANDLLGMLCSLFTLTPYVIWRRHHNAHHGSWSNLDRREIDGDIYSSCTTVAEYRALTPRARIRIFRLIRHPIVSQIILPPIVFLFVYRLPYDTPKSWKRERRAVYFTDIAIFATFGVLAMLLGVKQVLLVQLPVSILGAIVGVCLFSLQHRFEGALWARQSDWNVTDAALSGSSFLKLPRILQWFTGNIGFHHIHHLSPRVPNYRLQTCHAAIPALHAVTPVNWRDGIKAIGLTLWDEENHRMIRPADVAIHAH